MARSFTTYWTPRGWDGIEPGDRIGRSFGGGYGRRGLAPGDRLYVMNVKDRRFLLLGSFEVDEVLPPARAGRRGSRVRAGEFLAMAKPGTASTFDIRPLPIDVVRSLRFVSKDHPTIAFDAADMPDAQAIRSMRELTGASAARLDRFIERWSRTHADRHETTTDGDEAPADALASLGIPSRAEYGWALRSLERHLRPRQVRVLRAHYLAPSRTATMRELSKAALLDAARAANGVYGALGKLLAMATGRDLGPDVRARRANWAHMIATGVGRIGAEGGYELRLRHEFSAAMEDIGLVDPAELSPGRASDAESFIEESRDDAEQDGRPTERLQVQSARRGQGEFRAAVASYWGACAVTGCTQTSLLIASHIVPWKRCRTDRQRLDGASGLLLTPNLDKLFDRGLISFEDRGTLLVSPRLDEHARSTLGLTGTERVVGLTAGHRRNLAFHRRHVFRRTRDSPSD